MESPAAPFFAADTPSLRDWFAGMALQGLITQAGQCDEHFARHTPCAAEAAYEYADAMIEERKKNANTP
jgi:hypothetical protein